MGEAPEGLARRRKRWHLTSSFRVRGDAAAKFFLKPVNSTRRIHKLLVACKQGVAGGTNVHGNILLRTSRFDHVPTGAPDRDRPVFGVNILLHDD